MLGCGFMNIMDKSQVVKLNSNITVNTDNILLLDVDGVFNLAHDNIIDIFQSLDSDFILPREKEILLSEKEFTLNELKNVSGWSDFVFKDSMKHPTIFFSNELIKNLNKLQDDFSLTIILASSWNNIISDKTSILRNITGLNINHSLKMLCSPGMADEWFWLDKGIIIEKFMKNLDNKNIKNIFWVDDDLKDSKISMGFIHDFNKENDSIIHAINTDWWCGLTQAQVENMKNIMSN